MKSSNINKIQKACVQFNSGLVASLSDEAQQRGICIEADKLVCLV